MLTIAPATAADIPIIARLMHELDRFHGSPVPSNATESEPQIARALFDVVGTPSALLARWDGEAVGLLTYSVLWPAEGVTRSLFLKELYVLQSRRRRGIGAALMREVCRTAVAEGCSRVEWTTEATNTGAIGFYATLGATAQPQKVFYRLDGDALDLAAEGPAR